MEVCKENAAACGTGIVFSKANTRQMSEKSLHQPKGLSIRSFWIDASQTKRFAIQFCATVRSVQRNGEISARSQLHQQDLSCPLYNCHWRRHNLLYFCSVPSGTGAFLLLSVSVLLSRRRLASHRSEHSHHNIDIILYYKLLIRLLFCSVAVRINNKTIRRQLDLNSARRRRIRRSVAQPSSGRLNLNQPVKVRVRKGPRSTARLGSLARSRVCSGSILQRPYHI